MNNTFCFFEKKIGWEKMKEKELKMSQKKKDEKMCYSFFSF